ncbi:TonB-dependent receptor [Sphingomonas endophytica]|uniref:Outer membrane receptor protein involved in Fe transport n=1 Tax=Sphingomonas endophytica TaxID=869719 RepID=A0ABR6N703_9SPHN|nr:TonB-dependent receptor [Sphingomonas endophytica]MBB5726546.1 outer membrane receptor protein involved in Fe transport [Sphingomonas endophytica]
MTRTARLLRYRRLLALGCCLLTPAMPAAAQTAANTGDAPGDEVIVTGSRIPRTGQEGPAPVTTIDADTIRANGYTSVPDILRAVTQNGGETQSQQSFSGASFTPGAQQVDLRGLGPNHTLVLVNGRRIADFPLPFNGQSNFTDVSNIPVGLIQQVEVLSGSASAIYGSDAIAGVINFKLKTKVDGLTVDYRHGRTEHGGGDLHRLTGTAGWSSGDFHIIGGGEYLLQRPLWAYQRGIQDSAADNPTTPVTVGRRTFLRYDPANDEYVDPGVATCGALSYLNGGSTYYAARPRYGAFDDALDDYGPGRFCGSDTSIGYGTIISRREGFNSFVSAGYDFSEAAKLFVDAQFGISKVALMPDVLNWSFQDASGSSDATFFNSFDGVLDDWSRQFTPEESSGFARTMTRNRQQTFSITPGVRGALSEKWSYELSFNHSEYKARVQFPQIIAAKANALFLGAQEGVDADSGYPVFNADPARLYTPLTRAEYESIAVYSTYNPRSWTDNLSATITSTELFSLPAGPVGFAAVAEVGKQGYDLKPDPLALTDYYYGLKDSDGRGRRSHWAAGGELRVPLLSFLQASGAARYDHFGYDGNGIGKFTYNGGVELRPVSTLLLRAAYGTGFRAPDLHYVFTGPGNTHPSATDYYRCRTEEPDETIGDCSLSSEGIVVQRSGNRKLRPETSKSLNAGIVWAPSRRFDVSVDYFRVSMADQVRDLSTDTLLRDEADCRIGRTTAGTPVDIASPTCQDAIARIGRFASGVNQGALDYVAVNPINIAHERTTGIDVAVHGNLSTGIGNFALSAAHTHVFDHTFRQYPGDPTIDKLAFDSGYDIPRDKSTASVTWSADAIKLTVETRRLGKLPNYAQEGFIKASYLVNTTFQYDFTDHLRGSLSVTNVLDQKPIKDRTYAAYPYYDISWFDSVGRSVFLEMTWKLGGAAL